MSSDSQNGIELTYCTNVHPGESVDELIAMLGRDASSVRERWERDQMPIGLWMPHQAASLLNESESKREELRCALEDNGLYLATFNVFPYGGFHREKVKEAVYLPSWLDEERVRYTVQAAEVLAALLPEGGFGSMSTLSGAFRELEASKAALASHFLKTARALHQLRETTGRTIALAIEAEPFTTLETMGEMASFFESHLLDAGMDSTIVRRHLGVCYDICHQAVVFEEADASLRALVDVGVPIHKVQVSNAISVRPGDGGGWREALAAFEEPRYLHQTYVRAKDGTVSRFVDLPAFAQASFDEGIVDEVRIHFHVPLDVRELVGSLRTTFSQVPEVLKALGPSGGCRHFEVETYTWGVLPEEDRARVEKEGLAAAIAAELRCAESTLSDAGFSLGR